MTCNNLLDVLRLLKLFTVNTTVELDGFQADPLLGDNWNNVMATHHLSSLLPHVIDAQVHVWHSCAHKSVDSSKEESPWNGN